MTYGKKILIGTFYRPPNSTNEILTSIENSIGLAVDTNIQDILITGNLNLDVLTQNSNRKVSDICLYFGLSNIIMEPTHFTETSSSLIDVFLTSNSNNVLLSGVGDPFLNQNIRYHCPIFCVFKFVRKFTPVFSRRIWLYDRGNYESFTQDLSDTNDLKSSDIDTYANNMTDQILKLADKHIPNKNVKVRKTDPCWLNSVIKKLMRKRKCYYDKFKRTGNSNYFKRYKEVRNRVISEIRKSRKMQMDKLADNLKSDSLGPRDWWRTLKRFIKPSQTDSVPPLILRNECFSDNGDKATIFNDFFTDQSSLDINNVSLPRFGPQPDSTLASISLTAYEVESILKSLKTGKAAGPDTTNNRLLKALAHPLSSPLCDLFNFSLSNSTVPTLWKQANVTPVFKKDDPSEVSNYRPISLLSSVGKAFEKLIHRYVFNFFRDHQDITTLQSGFVPGDSTVNQPVDIYNTFCEALDLGKEVRVVFFDISKAFDRVWHEGLLFKLKTVGISGFLLQWFADYLNNRKQRVVLPVVTSS